MLLVAPMQVLQEFSSKNKQKTKTKPKKTRNEGQLFLNSFSFAGLSEVTHN